MNQQEIMTSEEISDYDAERGLISCTQDDDDTQYKIFAHAIEAGITHDHFQNEKCKQYWQALVVAEKAGSFGFDGALDNLPKSFLSENPWFITDVLGAHDIASFAKGEKAINNLVKAKQYRDLARISKELRMRVEDAVAISGDEPLHLATSTESQLQEIIIPKGDTLKNSKELTHSTIDIIKTAITQGPARIKPHLPWLERGLDGGFKNGHLVVVAARPGVGKTTLVVNTIYHEALRGKKTLFFSLEMKGEYLWEKLGLIRAGKGLSYKGDDKAVNERNAKELMTHIEACGDLPIYIDDNGNATISDIRASSKVMHRKVGLDCIVIDYCTLVKPEDPKVNREQQVAEISRQAKLLAKELDLPVFLIAQLNRDSVKKGVEPQLHDLRDSGQIEQDADVVILMHRDYVQGDKEDTKLIVAKNRFGGCGHSRDKIKFNGSAQIFWEEEPRVAPRLHDEKFYKYENEEPRI